MYFVYILQCSDNSLYTGITTNVGRRFAEHRAGIGAKYTRGRKPEKVVYQQKFRNRSNAQKREAEIKSWPRSQKLTLINV